MNQFIKSLIELPMEIRKLREELEYSNSIHKEKWVKKEHLDGVIKGIQRGTDRYMRRSKGL